MNDNYLTQLVNFPTRHDSILDLNFVIKTNIVSCVQAVDNLPGTDHEVIQFTLFVAPSRAMNYLCLLYDYKKADLDHFYEVLSRVPYLALCDDIDESWSMWKDLFFVLLILLFRRCGGRSPK